jgi:hypothetical protein
MVKGFERWSSIPSTFQAFTIEITSRLVLFCISYLLVVTKVAAFYGIM